MGIFSRRQHAAATTDTSTRHREKREPIVMNMNTRPSFGQWLKVTWLDIVTMIILGIIGLGDYEAHPAPSRSFPVYFQDGEIVYPQFAYPMRNEIVPICMCCSFPTSLQLYGWLSCTNSEARRGRRTSRIHRCHPHLPDSNPQLFGTSTTPLLASSTLSSQPRSFKCFSNG